MLLGSSLHKEERDVGGNERKQLMMIELRGENVEITYEKRRTGVRVYIEHRVIYVQQFM